MLFGSTNSGQRRARVLSGPEVWTIASAWDQQDPAERTIAHLADVLELPYAEVDDAIRYWAEHREEIDTLVTGHRETQDAALAEWQRHQDLLAS